MGELVSATPVNPPSVLDDLQQRIALAVAELDEGDGFVLAGGGALIVLGVISRSTQDLDYFTTRPEDVQPLADALIASLQLSGMKINVEQTTPTFVRLVVSLGDSQTRVDLSADARMLEPTHTKFGVALSIEELAIDKVLAIFGRAEARDFIDLVALQQRFGLPHLFHLAKQKDLGFDENIFRQMLDRFDRLTRDEFDVDDDTYARVRTTVDQWKAQTP